MPVLDAGPQEPLARPAAEPALKRELGVRDLTLFALACVLSVRWIPLAAQAGPGSVTLWLLAAAFFVVPLTAAVAALVAKYPRAGGLYVWTREDFGLGHGFFSAWTYWIGIAFLFPTAAMLYARVGFSLLSPELARLGDDRLWLLAATLALLWIALGANVVGVQVGKWAESLGAVATITVGVVIIGTAWLVWGRQGSATPMNIVPDWSFGTVSFFAGIAYATSGMEGPGMMAGEMRNPERTMRLGGWAASAIATVLYIGMTIAFLMVLPPDRITPLNGYAEVTGEAGRILGVPWLAPAVAVLVVVSGIGFVGGAGSATSRLPFAAAVDGLLPAAFARVHPRWRTPHVSILALGLVSTFLLIVYQLGDSVRAGYDTLVSMMVITGFVPYYYLFGSAWKAGRRVSAVLGTLVTTVAILAAVIPPPGVTSVWLFETKILAGTVGVVAVAWLVYRRRSAGGRGGDPHPAAAAPITTRPAVDGGRPGAFGD